MPKANYFKSAAKNNKFLLGAKLLKILKEDLDLIIEYASKEQNKKEQETQRGNYEYRYIDKR